MISRCDDWDSTPQLLPASPSCGTIAARQVTRGGGSGEAESTQHFMAALSSPIMIQRKEKQGDVAQYLTKACPQVSSVKNSLNGIRPHTSLRNIDVSHRDKRCTTSNTQTHVCSIFYRIFLQLRLHQTTAIDGADTSKFQAPSSQLSLHLSLSHSPCQPHLP